MEHISQLQAKVNNASTGNISIPLHLLTNNSSHFFYSRLQQNQQNNPSYVQHKESKQNKRYQNQLSKLDQNNCKENKDNNISRQLHLKSNLQSQGQSVNSGSNNQKKPSQTDASKKNLRKNVDSSIYKMKIHHSSNNDKVSSQQKPNSSIQSSQSQQDFKSLSSFFEADNHQEQLNYRATQIRSKIENLKNGIKGLPSLSAIQEQSFEGQSVEEQQIEEEESKEHFFQEDNSTYYGLRQQQFQNPRILHYSNYNNPQQKFNNKKNNIYFDDPEHLDHAVLQRKDVRAELFEQLAGINRSSARRQSQNQELISFFRRYNEFSVIRIIPEPDKIKHKLLTEDQIKEFLVVRYMPIEQDELCSVCLENFKIKNLVKILGCMHQFHPQCIDMWLKKSVNCPICLSDQQQFF